MSRFQTYQIKKYDHPHSLPNHLFKQSENLKVKTRQMGDGAASKEEC